MTPNRKDGTLVLEEQDPFRKEEEPAAPEAPAITTEAPTPMTEIEAKAAQTQLLDASVEETIRKQQHSLMNEEVKFAHYQRAGKVVCGYRRLRSDQGDDAGTGNRARGRAHPVGRSGWTGAHGSHAKRVYGQRSPHG